MARNPITWRNINAPSFGDVNYGLANASQTISRGIDGLTEAARNYETTRAKAAQADFDARRQTLQDQLQSEIVGFDPVGADAVSRFNAFEQGLAKRVAGTPLVDMDWLNQQLSPIETTALQNNRDANTNQLLQRVGQIRPGQLPQARELGQSILTSAGELPSNLVDFTAVNTAVNNLLPNLRTEITSTQDFNSSQGLQKASSELVNLVNADNRGAFNAQVEKLIRDNNLNGTDAQSLRTEATAIWENPSTASSLLAQEAAKNAAELEVERARRSQIRPEVYRQMNISPAQVQTFTDESVTQQDIVNAVEDRVRNDGQFWGIDEAGSARNRVTQVFSDMTKSFNAGDLDKQFPVLAPIVKEQGIFTPVVLSALRLGVVNAEVSDDGAVTNSTDLKSQFEDALREAEKFLLRQQEAENEINKRLGDNAANVQSLLDANERLTTENRRFQRNNRLLVNGGQ